MTSKARSTHEQSRARNKKFAEIAQSPEVRKILDCIPKSTHVSYLRNLCEEKYGFVIPPSLYVEITKESPTFADEPTDFVQPRIIGTAEHSE